MKGHIIHQPISNNKYLTIRVLGEKYFVFKEDNGYTLKEYISCISFQENIARYKQMGYIDRQMKFNVDELLMISHEIPLENMHIIE